MSKLTIRAAIEALTYADDQELIKELELRARERFRNNTYICDLSDHDSEYTSDLYSFYAESEGELIAQIAKCWLFIDVILDWYEYVSDWKLYEEDKEWREKLINSTSNGNEKELAKLHKIINKAIDDGVLNIRLLNEMEPE